MFSINRFKILLGNKQTFIMFRQKLESNYQCKELIQIILSS
jgi:hypothetical protein